MSSLGKIKCDLCNFVSDLETASVRGTMKTPHSWANIFTMVSIVGRKAEDNPKSKKERLELRRRLEKKFPVFHICPGCIKGEFDINTHLSLPGGMRTVNNE